MDHAYEPGAVEPKYEPQSPLDSMQRQIMPSALPAYSYPANHPLGADPMSARSAKRGYGKVFSETHIHQPFHDGMRPSSPDQGPPRGILMDTDNGHIADEVYSDIELMKAQNLLVYKRADGSHQTKKCPSPIGSSALVVDSPNPLVRVLTSGDRPRHHR